MMVLGLRVAEGRSVQRARSALETYPCLKMEHEIEVFISAYGLFLLADVHGIVGG